MASMCLPERGIGVAALSDANDSARRGNDRFFDLAGGVVVSVAVGRCADGRWTLPGRLWRRHCRRERSASREAAPLLLVGR